MRWIYGCGALVLSAFGALSAIPPAHATDNQTLSCATWRARKAGPPPGAALVANIPKSMTPIALDAVLYTDKKLERKVMVQALYARRTANDTLEVMARFVNCTSKPLQIEARSSFMDDQLMPTEKNSVWKPVFLQGKATAVYNEFSISRDEISHYLIEIRTAP